MKNNTITPVRSQESGIALILVLAVLTALLTMALPFSWSMRNHREAAEMSLNRSRVESDLTAARHLAHAKLAQSQADRDLTPLYDDEVEFRLGLDELREEFLETAPDPRTQNPKIWSAKAIDASGLVNLESASMFLLANLFGLSARVGVEISEDPGVSEIRLDAADGFPETGILWVNGELIGYEQQENGRFSGLSRGMTTAVVSETKGPRVHQSGTYVVDYRVWLLAHLPYEWVPGSLTEFNTVDELRNIVRMGLFGFTYEELERVKPFLTVDSPWPTSRFINPQNLISTTEAGRTTDFRVSDGRHVAQGSILRLSGWNGDVDYRMVLSSRQVGQGQWSIEVDRPLSVSLRSDEAIVETLSRHPININSAPLQVLRAMLESLQFIGTTSTSNSTGLTRDVARSLADVIVKRRPFVGWSDYDQFLDDLEKNGIISKDQRYLLLVHGFDSQDRDILGGTAPFSFSSAGTFQIDTAVSDNYPRSNKERARLFSHETISIAPSGTLTEAFLSQRDFQEQIRINRQGRYWATDPQNLYLDDQGSQPPREILTELYQNLDRYASEEARESRAFLAPSRVEYPPRDPRMIHFDEGEYLSEHIDGWQVSDGSRTVGTREGLAELVRVVGSQERLRPFSVSMWWQPENTSGEHVLFHMGRGDGEDEIILRCTDGVLRLSVFDHSFPRLLDTGDQTAGEWIYEFDDGLALENDVPYHVAFQVKGNRPEDLVLCVDGIPRGRAKYRTRLSGGLQAAQDSTLGGVLTSPPVGVEESDDFEGRGVIQVGPELVEYTSASGGRFNTDPEDEGKREVFLHDGPGGPLRRTPNVLHSFGGRGARFTDSPSHKSGSDVTLYGYTGLLGSELPGTSTRLTDALSRFQIARVTTERGDLEPITLPPPPGGGGGGGFGGSGRSIGVGIPSNMKEIPMMSLSGDTVPNDIFQASGGYALLMSLPVGSIRRGNQDQDSDQDGARFGGTELIFYTGFSSGRLTGVVRGYELSPAQIPTATAVDGGNLLNSTSHVAFWTGGLSNANNGNILIPGNTHMGTFVIPISVSVANASQLVDLNQGAPGEAPPCNLVQVDLDFPSVDQGSTEWIRFNSVVSNRYLVRDDPEIIRRIQNYMGGGAGRDTTEGFQIPANRYWFWRDPESQNPSKEDELQEFREVNYEAVIEEYGENPQESNRLAFRGVLGTFECRHSAGATVLPVSRFFKRGRAPSSARPGRHDVVTLVSFDNGTREIATINHAWCGPSEDWRNFSHVAFRDVTQAFSPGTSNNQGGASGSVEEEIEQIALNGDSQGFTRMLKFPSGELPFEIQEEIYLGGDAGGASNGNGFIDEVRFWRPEDAGPGVEHGRYILNRELEESSDESMRISTNVLGFAHGHYARDVFPAYFDEHFPDDGGLALVGAELIAFNGASGGQTEAVVELAPEGRGFLGTEASYHEPGTPVTWLSFIPVSRLTAPISATEAFIEISDASDFPNTGLIRINNELIIYDRKEGNRLILPQKPQRGGRVGEAIFRGRYGTYPEGHSEGDLVVLHPVRYWDRYEEESNHPSMSPLQFDLSAEHGFFRELNWDEELPSERVDLVAYVLVDNEANWDDSVDESSALFRFDSPKIEGRKTWIGRYGDHLTVRFYVHYLDSAYDPIQHNRSDWKRTPTLLWTGIDYLRDTTVHQYQEFRR